MYDINKLKKLREKTGISFSLCKKALEETNNDLNKAKKLLSQWGADKAKDKESKETKVGAIFSYVHHNRKLASLVEIVCETDFVSNNDNFKQLGQEIAIQIASLKPQSIDELLNQEYVRDPSKKISDLIKDSILKFGENIKINRILYWEI